jgi:hypothetical protein
MPGPPRSARRGKFLAVSFLLCVSFIFATSCTVVRPQEFFDWIHRHLIHDDSFFARFQVFWGFSWFAVVKGWHAIEFALLLLFAVATLNWLTGRRTRQNLAIGVAFCVAFAISDEWHQSFVPDRVGTVTDVLIDCMGVFAAALLLFRTSKAQRD